MSAMLKQKLIDISNGFTKYGLWKGSGSSSLSEMTDVTFSNLQSNDVLTYNGSEWVNDDNLQTQIDTLNSNLAFKELTLPNPTITSNDRFKIITYTIDLSEYNIFAPLVFVESFNSCGWPIYYGFASNSLYFKDIGYSYEWSGSINITTNSIQVITSLNSTNVSINYFSLKSLYVRKI